MELRIMHDLTRIIQDSPKDCETAHAKLGEVKWMCLELLDTSYETYDKLVSAQENLMKLHYS